MKRKVLLMGASGSGKTSMRSLIFSNNPASLTSRFGATIDVEQNHVRFLGDLILNLWDCGGQDAFMDSYLSTQQSTMFSHVEVLIYVFEVESRNMLKDLEYYTDCLKALKKYSPEADVFLLVHKMDLVRPAQKRAVLEKKWRELKQASGDHRFSVFGTSIYDETLYKAWSRIVHTLIPNVSVLTKHLTTLADACGATEVILFERTTFLVIATSAAPPSVTAPPQPISPLSVPTSRSTAPTPITAIHNGSPGTTNGNGNGSYYNGTNGRSTPAKVRPTSPTAITSPRSPSALSFSDELEHQEQPISATLTSSGVSSTKPTLKPLTTSSASAVLGGNVSTTSLNSTSASISAPATGGATATNAITPPVAPGAAASTRTNGTDDHTDQYYGPYDLLPPDPHELDPARYERTSELIKAFKHSCARVRDEFYALEMELAEFTAVLDELTKNTCVLIVVHDPAIETAAVRMNIRLARKKFQEIQGETLS